MGEYKADRTQIGNTKSQNEILEQIKNERKTANNKIEKRKFHTPKRLAYNLGGVYDEFAPNPTIMYRERR